MSFDLDKVFYDQDAAVNGYELAEADAPAVAPAVNAAQESGDAKPKAPTVLDRRLAEHEFSKEIRSLLPDSSPIALTCWINYALSLEYDGKQPATQCFTELTAALASVKRHYGEEIATQVFHVAFEMPIPVSDIHGAANHLKNGGELNDIIELSLDGKLQSPSPLSARTLIIPHLKHSLRRGLPTLKASTEGMTSTDIRLMKSGMTLSSLQAI